MGLTKTNAFTKQKNRMANYAKALGNPARIAILELLLQHKTCICGDIVEQLPLSQATVSQHLRELKKAGLIQGTIEGPRTCYCINPQAWEEAGKMLWTFMNQEPGNIHPDNCC